MAWAAAPWKKEESAGAQPTQPKGIFRDGQPSLNPALYMAVREHSTLTRRSLQSAFRDQDILLCQHVLAFCNKLFSVVSYMFSVDLV